MKITYTKKNILAFLYSLSMPLKINFIGQMMLAEILALMYLPFVKPIYHIRKNKNLAFIILGFTLLLMSQIFSDIVNQTSSTDFLRGWANIGFSIVSLILLYYSFSRNEYGALYFLFAAFLSRLFFYDADNSDIQRLETLAESTNYFKVRFIPFVNPAILLLIYLLYKRNNLFSCHIIILVYSFISFYFDARSNGVVFLLSFIILYISNTRIKINAITLLFYFIISSTVLYGTYIVYVNQVLNHEFGGKNAQTQLNSINNPYNPFELLLEGRGAISTLSQAIIDKPFSGHGSWGKDLYGFYSENKNQTIGYIEAHSVILGFFAYAGVLGFICILYIYSQLYLLFYKIYTHRLKTSYFPVIVILTISSIWSLFFSPIGILRVELPFSVALLLTEYSRIYSHDKNKYYYNII